MKANNSNGSSDKSWIGVDLDGTLAEYHGWVDATHIGQSIPLMVERVKRWLSEGKKVKIFTSRVSQCHDHVQALAAKSAIQNFCLENFGQILEITSDKDCNMIEIWDDRAVMVEKNTGRTINDILMNYIINSL